MRELELELLSEEPAEIEKSRKELIATAYEFRDHFAMGNPDLEHVIYTHRGDLPEEQKPINNFFHGLVNAAFWKSINFLDGRLYYQHKPLLGLVKSEEETKKLREESRKRAKELFSEWDMQKLCKIIVNQALLKPFETSWPGTYRGHSILFEEFVDKEDSMFRPIVTRDFKKRLNNGRFWEEMIGMSPCVNYGHAYRVINDVLLNHSHDLDINFAKKGFEMFYKNNGERSEFDLGYLDDEAVARYKEFIERLDKEAPKLGIKDDIQYLVRPYVLDIIEFNNVREIDRKTRFGSSEECKKRFRENLPQKYIRESDIVSKAVAKALALHARYANGPDKEAETFAFLEMTPDQYTMFNKMLKEMDSRDAAEFAYKCGKKGLSLERALNPHVLVQSVN